MYRTKAFEEEALKELKRWEDARKHIPTQSEIDEAASYLNEYGVGNLSAAMEEVHVSPGTGIGVSRIFGDFVIVYWAGDPVVRAFIAAGVEDLPKFLACEDPEIVDIAKQKLDLLTGAGE